MKANTKSAEAIATFRDSCWPEWGFDRRARYRDEPALKVFKLKEDALRLTAVEIEAENPAVPSHTVDVLLKKIPRCVWQTAPEGSLRNDGFEVVFKKPLPFDAALASLSQAYPLLNGAKSTFRAAVHVHFNVQDLSRRQYIRVALMYALVEPNIYTYVGNGRDESIFCVPWTRSTHGIMNLLNAYAESSSHHWMTSIHSFSKYSGLNLQATSKYGSIEFRHLQTPTGGDVDSIERVADYMEVCYWVINTALDYDGKDTLHDFISYAIDCISSEGYQVPTPKHMAHVYSLLLTNDTLDPLAAGLSVKAARDVGVHMLPDWARDNMTSSGRRRLVPRPSISTYARSIPASLSVGTTAPRTRPRPLPVEIDDIPPVVWGDDDVSDWQPAQLHEEDYEEIEARVIGNGLGGE